MVRRTRPPPPDMGPLYAKVEPILDDIEKFRRGSLLFFLFAATVLAVPAALVGMVMIWAQAGDLFFDLRFLGPGENFMLVVYVTAAASYFLFVTCVYRILDHDYRKRCKRKFTFRLAQAMGMRYSPGGQFHPGNFYPHYIIPPYIRAAAEDHISFRYNGRNVEIQEALFYGERSEDTHFYNPLAYFARRGLMIRIESRRQFAVHTLAIPKSLFANTVYRNRFMGLANYERAPFGNWQFRRKYLVLTQASDEAHLIFDPAFLERFFAFEKILGAKSLSISFMKNEIALFADHGHDFLEAGHLLRPVTFDSVDRILDDLRMLASIIDHLELNPHTGV